MKNKMIGKPAPEPAAIEPAAAPAGAKGREQAPRARSYHVRQQVERNAACHR
jgi:hypothetical protein